MVYLTIQYIAEIMQDGAALTDTSWHAIIFYTTLKAISTQGSKIMQDNVAPTDTFLTCGNILLIKKEMKCSSAFLSTKQATYYYR